MLELQRPTKFCGFREDMISIVVELNYGSILPSQLDTPKLAKPCSLLHTISSLSIVILGDFLCELSMKRWTAGFLSVMRPILVVH